MGPQTPLAKYFKPRVARVTKRTVGYRPADGERDCAGCIMFHYASGSCDLVYGKIRPQDVCDRWESVSKGWRVPGG